MKDVSVDVLMPNVLEHRKLADVPLIMKDLNAVKKWLQDHTLTLAATRALSIAEVEDDPTIAHRLSPSANIVHCPIFENAVLKQQMNEASRLDATEKQAFSSSRQAERARALEGKNSIVERAANRLKTQELNKQGAYVDSRFILPTSDIW